MNATLASLVYVCGIAGLFWLDRDKSVRTSKALWLPVLYLWILGSRPVSVWLGVSPADGVNTQLEGSPVDAAFFGILLMAALGVLIHRGRRVFRLVNTNLPILIYFSFCLVSVVWSDYPFASLKKWVKSTGDLAMILIVLTDEQPVAALRRLFSRTAFLLIPLSLLFIKYYPNLGRSYDLWTGLQMNNGAALDKNMLGVTTFVLSLAAFWRFLGLLWPDEVVANRRRHLLAHGLIVVLGAVLLNASNSATSTVCFALGAGLILATRHRFVRRNPATVHILVFSLLATAGLAMLLGAGAHAASVLGRKSNLTGRTDIWAAVIPMARNPLLGAGFESFWLSPDVKARLAVVFPGLPLNEAHNGYIEVYLELGWVGLALISLLLIDGYRRSVKAFRRDPAFAGLLIAYIFAAMFYNITEAGFRMLGLIWILFLLSVIEASILAAGTANAVSELQDARGNAIPILPTGNAAVQQATGRTVSGKVVR